MKMLYEKDLQGLHVEHLLQYNRDDIYEQLANWRYMTPELLSIFLTYSYNRGTVNYKWVKIVEDRMTELTDYAEFEEYYIKKIIAETNNPELKEKIMVYLEKNNITLH